MNVNQSNKLWKIAYGNAESRKETSTLFVAASDLVAAAEIAETWLEDTGPDEDDNDILKVECVFDTCLVLGC
jgi:hypothetical protein